MAGSTWNFSIDWYCDGGRRGGMLTFNADLTSSYNGKWQLDGTALELTFPTGETYIGTLQNEGTSMEGTMSDARGNSGCWTANRAP